MAGAGYSGTPLATKLGIKAGMTVITVKAPDELASWLEPVPEHVTFRTRLAGSADIVLFFTTSAAALRTAWPKLVVTGRAVWVCWPKKASRVATDMTEDVVRAVVLPTGWVDVKVCAVSEVWSALRLVPRRA
jgi:hypothetical protein